MIPHSISVDMLLFYGVFGMHFKLKIYYNWVTLALTILCSLRTKSFHVKIEEGHMQSPGHEFEMPEPHS